MTPAQRAALKVALRYLTESLKTRAVDTNFVASGAGSPAMKRRAAQYGEIAGAMQEIEAMLNQKEML